MDVITLILAALTAGVTAGTQTIANEAIRDAYNSLKELIQRKFADRPEAELALIKHAEKPEVWEEPLRDAITNTGADKDEEIINAAQRVIVLSDPQKAAIGKFNIQIEGKVQGVVQGDNAKVNMTFTEKSEKKRKK